MHRLQPDEVEALQELRERYPQGYFLFSNERGVRLTTGAIAKIMKRAGELAELAELPTRDIQEYLGYRNISCTVRYTAANPARFDRIVWSI